MTEIGFPRELRLERQLVSSIMMAWTAPDHVPQAQIQAYQVYVDGHQRYTVRGNDRTKALVEKVDIAKVWLFLI
jgi:RIMS-binding protein 2